MSSDEEEHTMGGNRKKEEGRKFADLAKKKINQWVEEGRIEPLPVTLTDEILLPRPPSAGIHYCIICRKHGSFRLGAHIRSKHPEYPIDSDDFRVIEQVSRGITENMKRASVDLRLVPAPMNIREYNIMKALIDQLTAGGIPIYGQIHQPSWEAMPYQESTEVSHAPRLDPTVRQHQGLPEDPSAAVKSRTVVSLPYGAPPIPRHELYMTPIDTLYLGGASIHPQFTAPPRVDLMFAHEHDTSVPGSFEQRYPIQEGRSCDWMLEADRKLKLWRRLPLELHPLLKQFCSHIETRVLLPDFGSEKGEIVVLKGRALYESYISRFMIVAMRARQRLGQTVSMDDGIYSSAVVMEFFQELQKCRVPVKTRLGFAQAIASFYDFLNVYIDAAASTFRLPAVAQARSRISYVIEGLRNELRSLSSYRAVRQAPAKEHEPYVVARAIAKHRDILATLRCIYNKFGRTEFISRVQYNYFLGALMFYIIQCNTARNEVVYKMRFGSIVDFSEMGHAQTGLRRIELDVDGDKKELFVGF
ncbi:unnamed protein product [Cylicocyclus nassatus]|uniref:Uncharacterized protein n=1 Tax=Cylicocyclus nassatus TaxID=53992 RepID=A0AA36GUC7_CYLNA|nr:unnamed protein product [Cylicocyclus nassatus]